MRKAIVIGNITRDAEVKNFEGNRSVISFDLAVNERWKDRNGTKQEKVHYLKCVLWRENTAIAQYLLKGAKILVEGTPEAEAYINKENKVVAIQKITVREMEFLSSVKKADSTGSQATPVNDDPLANSKPDDDLPF